jgi:anthranilate synthase/aminodeoxychorismate synthase-like glutamine amidotransferase
MILVIDNYDSFTYNLVELIKIVSCYQSFLNSNLTLTVLRNDQTNLEFIKTLNISGVVISPGPQGPEETGITLEVFAKLDPKIPILGVCLGHQALGHFYGAKVAKAKKAVHGERVIINHTGDSIFQGVAQNIKVARYNSLIVLSDSFPNNTLKVLAHSEEGEIMALEHMSLPRFGVQFHPESFLSEKGEIIIKNFLLRCIRRG